MTVAVSIGLAVGAFGLVPALSWVLVRAAAAAEARATSIAEGTVEVTAASAILHTNRQLTVVSRPKLECIGGWRNVADWIELPFEAGAGRYHVDLEFACDPGQAGSTASLMIGAEVMEFTVPQTGGPFRWSTKRLGTVTIDRDGAHRAELRATDLAATTVMNVRTLTLIPAG